MKTIKTKHLTVTRPAENEWLFSDRKTGAQYAKVCTSHAEGSPTVHIVSWEEYGEAGKEYTAEGLKLLTEYLVSEKDVYFADLTLPCFTEEGRTVLTKCGYFPENANGAGTPADGELWLYETPMPIWTAVYMCFGLSCGMAVGMPFDNPTLGMCFGIAIGAAIGALLDKTERDRRKAAALRRKNEQEGKTNE